MACLPGLPTRRSGYCVHVLCVWGLCGAVRACNATIAGDSPSHGCLQCLRYVCVSMQVLIKVYKALGTNKDYVAFSQRFKAAHPGSRPGERSAGKTGARRLLATVALILAGMAQYLAPFVCLQDPVAGCPHQNSPCLLQRRHASQQSCSGSVFVQKRQSLSILKTFLTWLSTMES